MKILREKWETLSRSEREDLAYRLAKLCNVTTNTVLGWVSGYRNPKAANREIIENYLSNKKKKHERISAN